MNWYEILFLKYLKGLASKARMYLKMANGGTMQLLPVNDDEPETSPFLGEIQYPNTSEAVEEYFTYKQVSTSDKPSALVWNQLVNSTSTTSTVNGVTYTNNGDGSWTVNGTATGTAQKAITSSDDRITATNGHKYLMLGCASGGSSSKYLMQLYKNNANTLVGTDTGNGFIYTADSTTINLSVYFTVYSGQTVNFKIYPQIFDLTTMYGAGNEPTAEEFLSKYPNAYYPYHAPEYFTGKARIKSIKGNTLVWNQFNKNTFQVSNATVNVSGTTVTITENRTNAGTTFLARSTGFSIATGHKILVKLNLKEINVTDLTSIGLYFVSSSSTTRLSDTWSLTEVGMQSHIFVPTGEVGRLVIIITTESKTGTTDNIVIGDLNIFDLTTMFGSGKEPTVEEFKSLFSLNYYAYDSGSLLNFNGTGIKTTGKNFVTNYLSNSTTVNISWAQSDGVVTFTGKANGTTRTPNLTSGISLKKGNYILSGSIGGSSTTYALRLQVNSGGSWTGYGDYNYDGDTPFTLYEDSEVRLTGRFDKAVTAEYNVTMYPMIRYADADSTFEPYTTSTTSLPISTYFTDGMKSAGSVYDELSDKAITRVGSVNLGSLTWERTTTQGSDYRFYSSGIANLVKKPSSLNEIANITCGRYVAEIGNAPNQQKVGVAVHTNGNILIYDTAYSSSTADAFKTAMSGVYLNYELATPTEQDVDPEDTQLMLNRALSTILGRTVSVDNPQPALDILTKGE